MKKLFLTLCLILGVFTAFAQTLKTYKFSDEISSYTYTYYEDEKGDLVKHGNYVFTENTVPVKDCKIQKKYSGTFKDGYRDGTWTFTITTTDMPDASRRNYITSKINMIQNYKAGVPNGIWTYFTNIQQRKRKTVYKDGNQSYQWLPFEKLPSETINANFCDGFLCGNFYFSVKGEEYKGAFDSLGYRIGKWSSKHPVFDEYIDYRFDEGILSYKIHRRSNGNIFGETKYDQELLDWHKEILEISSEEEREIFLEKHRLRISAIPTNTEMKIDDFFFNLIFKQSEIGGVKDVWDGEVFLPESRYGGYFQIERY